MHIIIAKMARGGWVRDEVGDFCVAAFCYWLTTSDPLIESITLAKVDEVPLHCARNNICLKALMAHGDNGIVFQLDADMIPSKDFFAAAIAHLHNYPDSVIGSPYCASRAGQRRVLVLEGKTRQSVPRAHALRRKGIERVAAVGTGCIAISTRLLRKMNEPWFHYEYTTGAQTVMAGGEDFTFCKNVWDTSGCAVFCAWDFWSGHGKSEDIGKPEEGDL